MDLEVETAESGRQNGDISLSDEDTVAFIDLYESFPVLWDNRHPQYGMTRARLQALRDLAQQMGKNWNRDQVRRKIESLRSQYNRVKKKKPSGSASGVGTVWMFYDRMRAFLGQTEILRDDTETAIKFEDSVPGVRHFYPPMEDRLGGEVPQFDQSQWDTGQHYTGYAPAPDRPTPVLLTVAQEPTCSSSNDSYSSAPCRKRPPPLEMGFNIQQTPPDSEPNSKKKRGLRCKQNDKLEDAIIQMASAVSQPKSPNRFLCYAQGIAERLHDIASFEGLEESKRLKIIAIARRKIDSALSDAEMALCDG